MYALRVFLALVFGQALVGAEQAPAEIGEPLEPVLGAYWPYAMGETGGFVNLRIVDSQFRLYYLEADRKTVAEPAFPHAVVHFSNTQRRSLNNQTLTLSSGAGPFLGSPRFIQAPHRYQVRVFLTREVGQGDGDAKGVMLGQQILNQLTDLEAE